METKNAWDILEAEFKKLGYEGEIKPAVSGGSEVADEEPAELYLQEPKGHFTVHHNGRIEDHDGVLKALGKERTGLC